MEHRVRHTSKQVNPSRHLKLNLAAPPAQAHTAHAQTAQTAGTGEVTRRAIRCHCHKPAHCWPCHRLAANPSSLSKGTCQSSQSSTAHGSSPALPIDATPGRPEHTHRERRGAQASGGAHRQQRLLPLNAVTTPACEERMDRPACPSAGPGGAVRPPGHKHSVTGLTTARLRQPKQAFQNAAMPASHLISNGSPYRNIPSRVLAAQCEAYGSNTHRPSLLTAQSRAGESS